jgi:polyhydroxyalkanoate synthesis repressor PhaR
MDDAASKPTVTIKKYANRRLYNTATSSYVTLDHLASMVKSNVEFNVYDAKTGEDITRSVLTQIIVEEESKAGQNLLPISFLRQLIGFYGDNMQWLVPKYLEHSMQTLAKNQEQIRGYFQNTFGSMFPFGTTLEEMGKQNLAMFERAMRLFSPFGGNAPEESRSPAAAAAAEHEDEEDEPAPAPMPSPAPAARSVFTATSFSSNSNVPAPAAPPPVMAPPPAPMAAPMSPSMSSAPMAAPMPRSMPMAVADDPAPDQDVQRKIAALQRQLADLAKSKG